MTEPIYLNFSPVDRAFDDHQHLHIWFLNLSQSDQTCLAKFTSIISPSERERVYQFKFKHLQERAMAIRIFVRLCLARYAKTDPRQLEFASTVAGKPYLLNVPQPLFFNLSHTDDLLVLAISAQGEVGIDIETKRNHNFWDISKRFFHPDELARMEALDQQERERSFYRLWTLKEAFFKALGIGITAGLDKIQIDLGSEPVHFTVAKGLNVPQVNWRLVEMPLNESTFLAVAHNQPIAEPRWFDGRLLLVADN